MKQFTADQKFKTACRPWPNNKIYWVSDIRPLDGKGDWGYTEKSAKARPLTPADQKRFARDCNNGGVNAIFYPFGCDKEATKK